MTIRLYPKLTAFVAVSLAVAWMNQTPAAAESAKLIARLAADGRSFTISTAGFEDFRATWSASIQRDGAPARLLASTDGVVTPGPVTTIRFPEENIELLFQLESRTDAPAVMARAGIRNTGTAPVKLHSVTAIAAEWQLPANLNGWFLTGFHPPTAVLQGLRFLHQPVLVHEYGGFYHTAGAGFLFGPVGEPVADLNSRWMKMPENKMSFQCAAQYERRAGGSR